MDEKIKIWTIRFPAKENPNKERASFNWPMLLQHDVKAEYPQGSPPPLGGALSPQGSPPPLGGALSPQGSIIKTI